MKVGALIGQLVECNPEADVEVSITETGAKRPCAYAPAESLNGPTKDVVRLGVTLPENVHIIEEEGE